MQVAEHAFLVAGGGSGLGAATAKMLLDAGARVVIADLSDAAGWSSKPATSVRFVKTDVTDEGETQAAVELCASAFGAIHGAINCAGVAPGERVVGKTGPHALASFERAIRINLVGTFNVIRLAAARMTTQAPEPTGERGVIVNTSSVASMDGQIGQAAYAASKAGVNGMTLPIARELARFGVRVMTIAPGIFDTPMLQGMSEEIRASLGAQIPFPSRLGKPEEYAALVRHIIENEVLNGEVIRLDGAIRMAPEMTFVEVEGRLECLDLPATRPDRPEVLLLHEGLGSVSMWRDFPQRVALATGCRTLAYSRHGFGRSTPRTRPWTPRFVHEEALEVIPRLREALGIANPVLLGHSTGASIALVHAGAGRWPVAGVIAMAPLTDVEDSNVEAILAARRHYESSDWRAKLARHHDDVDAVFYGWNDTWTRPDFRAWNLRADLAGIRAPILAILGKGDEYATPAQVELIRRLARQARSFEFLHLDDCGHAPHRDQPEAVLAAVIRLLDTV